MLLEPIAACVVTCEHAGARVPAWVAAGERRTGTRGPRGLLGTHRGFDRGAIALARDLARAVGVEAILGTTTRLLVDLNRSPGHAEVFGTWGRRLDDEARRRLMHEVHEPHWARVRERVRSALDSSGDGLVLHVGVHTFTPVLRGERRRLDVGLLFDPERPMERALCESWRDEIGRGFTVRLNEPYSGASDGLTTSLRHEFPRERYLGIELEVNQRLVSRPEWARER